MGPPGSGSAGPPAAGVHTRCQNWFQRIWEAAVAFREVGVHEIREVLRLWLRGEGLRPAARLGGGDRKAVARVGAAGGGRGRARRRGGGGPGGEVRRPGGAASRQWFVWLCFGQALAAVMAGCEAAWAFFGGVFAVIIPDNMSAIVDRAHPTEPRLNRAFAEYAQDRGFVIDPARIRRPQDKPRVERAVPFVRGSFFAGESFPGGLPAAQRAAAGWCTGRAGRRIPRTTRCRPGELFAAQEAPRLAPAPGMP